MKWARELQRWEFSVTSIERDRIFLLLVDITAGETMAEEEMAMPIGTYIRLFGRRAVREGQIGWLIVKQCANGRVTLRGWPWHKRWTQEDIDHATAYAERLWQHLTEEDTDDTSISTQSNRANSQEPGLSPAPGDLVSGEA